MGAADRFGHRVGVHLVFGAAVVARLLLLRPRRRRRAEVGHQRPARRPTHLFSISSQKAQEIQVRQCVCALGDV